jgi:hypothetical protein
MDVIDSGEEHGCNLKRADVRHNMVMHVGESVLPGQVHHELHWQAQHYELLLREIWLPTTTPHF